MECMDSPRIRSVETSHLGDLIRIAEETNLNRWTAQHYLEELKSTASIMYRLESVDNETIGFIVGRTVASNDDEASVDAEIYNIGVDPKFQRRGHGQVLLTAFLDACRELNVQKIWLEVRENNAPAVGLYATNGFIPVTIRKDFYSDPRENGILMCRGS